ncbi:MAG: CBS domain-containing protein [Deltaproteobacteria bacterium]|nr:CBS domain-containing protein [Deltaproteobacteria bacterium]
MISNKVSEIMTTHLITAPAAATIFDVMQAMVTEDVGRIVITDDEVPVGIFTEKDILRRVIGGNVDTKKSDIKSVMTAPVQAVDEETHIVDAFARMYQGNYRHLLVRGRRGKIIGIVSMRRILNLAVELGQVLSETRALSDIAVGPMVSAEATSTIFATVELMNRRNIGAVIVTDAGKPVGIFTERDVLKRCAAVALDLSATAIKQVMTAPLVTMPATQLVGDVLAEMYRRDIRNMAVTNAAGAVTGIIAMPEILQYARAFNIDEQVRRSWREVARELASEDQYTPG